MLPSTPPWHAAVHRRYIVTGKTPSSFSSVAHPPGWVMTYLSSPVYAYPVSNYVGCFPSKPSGLRYGALTVHLRLGYSFRSVLIHGRTLERDVPVSG